MRKIVVFLWIVLSSHGLLQHVHAQTMTPELLWSLGRVSPAALSSDGKLVYYQVRTPILAADSFSTSYYALDLSTGASMAVGVQEFPNTAVKASPDRKLMLYSAPVKLLPVTGDELFEDLPKSEAYIYDQLHFRHWDAFEDGTFQHLFIRPAGNAQGEPIDLMAGQKFDCPTVPFGGAEDYVWSPDGSSVTYVCKKAYGTAYVNSTNTDLYRYDVRTGSTVNLTEGNPGYDTSPKYSSDSRLAWLQMDEAGYEADKNDLLLMDGDAVRNLTAHWDGTVNEFIWSEDGKSIYFCAPTAGTVQIFKVATEKPKQGLNPVVQVTSGVHDLHSLTACRDGRIYAVLTTMNRAAELCEINLSNGEIKIISDVNGELYSRIKPSKVEAKTVVSTDGKPMLVWVIYPPDFDASKSYPALLYAQGGPQSALTQFYSFRWNFQLMAAQGYIVVAPNRRGMPGYGVEWNEQISGDWGGQNMADYLAAIRAVAAEPYVDEQRLGCVGASFGGYSAYFLAGTHEGLFQTFIAHDGVFNTRSMYGTTEELFFVNHDFGGPYWSEDPKSRRAYTTFNPINYVQHWTKPILIIQGGKDYRVPEGQAFEAFTAAQQRGIKSRLLYLPTENHWVLSPQNGVLWQRVFFDWLKETL